ncbi:hypothetical protein F6X40_11195 [Paraburkholderia sp. UCT31]|uniref:hypothetical protein n=1 Tax=Paraburkholderia sp. UCT31 TaxID=2615209 RepID=UPI001654F8A1|nr:hypothetical protein [Paraburkholderia sp. UCT31]MBC8737369.1 hypothetical protein [Paraburkholderia sp. UCT31]
MKRLLTLVLLLISSLCHAELPDDFIGDLQRAVDTAALKYGITATIYLERMRPGMPMVARVRDKQCQIVFDVDEYDTLNKAYLRYFPNRQDALNGTVVHEMMHCVQMLRLYKENSEYAIVAPRHANEAMMLEKFIAHAGESQSAFIWREFQADAAAMMYYLDNGDYPNAQALVNVRHVDGDDDPGHDTAFLLSALLADLSTQRPDALPRAEFSDRVIAASERVFLAAQKTRSLKAAPPAN